MARARGRGMFGMLLTLNVSVLIGMGTMAGVVAVTVHYVRALSTARTEAERSMTAIVVATHELEFGRAIGADDVELFEVPSEIIAPGTHVELAKVIGRVPVERLLPGDAIRDERLSRPGAGVDFEAVLAAGTRAQMINLTDAESGSGMLAPGDRVDVIATVFGDDGRPCETRTLLHGVRVLAVDDRLLAAEERGTALKVGITLEVGPREAELLTLGARTGPLHLTVLGATETNSEVAVR